MKKLLILLCAFIATGATAQMNPGHTLVVKSITANDLGGGGTPLFAPPSTPFVQTSNAIAEAITPDIQALAQNLGNDPTRIFNYVHDEIRYVHYFGSKKGAELTLLERSGNDFDQCALLSSLLQAAGLSPSYQFGVMQMPYTSSDHQDISHWFGLSLPNTNWDDTTAYFQSFFGERGNPVLFVDDSNTIGFQRVWVTLTLGGTNFYLDPSFKVSEPIVGINLDAAIALNTNTLNSETGGSDSGYSISGVSESALRNRLQICNSNFLVYLSNNLPNASVAGIVGGQSIVSSRGTPLQTSLQFPLYTNSPYGLLNWTNQPTSFMSTFSVTLGGTNKTWYAPELAGQKVSLTFDGTGLAQLWLEDSLVLQTTNTGSTNATSVVLGVTHPYGSWDDVNNVPVDDGPTDGFDINYTNDYQRTNASYALVYSYEPSMQSLQKRQQKLNAYLQQGYSVTSRQVVTENLNVLGINWALETYLTESLIAQQLGLLPQIHHSWGRTGQELNHGYYVDVPFLDGIFPATGYGSSDIANQYRGFDLSTIFGSALEHGIIEQLQNTNMVASSTVKMLEIANTNGQAVYLAYSGNWNSSPNIRSSLVGYDTNTLAVLDGYISQGAYLFLPKYGNNTVAGSGTWAGEGFYALASTDSGRSFGAIIGGGYNGGYAAINTAVLNALLLSTDAQTEAWYFNAQPTTVQFGFQLGADPVNLADGSFQISSTDLSLGQVEPKGLNLGRFYSSARRNSNPTGMGPGWLHSFYCTANALSDSTRSLGETTPQQMSPIITAVYATLKIYDDVTLDPKNWMLTTLMSKWAVDQLNNNAVTVNLGKDSLEFVRQPDGFYTPPAGSTMSLLQTNGIYWLQERHGRTFKFNVRGLLTNIVDQYSQSMKLYYNSNNLLTNVTDWQSRFLTFVYTSNALTSVLDNNGRSVSYGYTNGDLIAFTDAEQKTCSYLYDTNHQVVATSNALGQLIVTNIYDSFGHVTTQLTQGDTNKMWQISASGYDTQEIDPAGGVQIFGYDTKLRPTSYQDASGNVTKTFYDGQDHVVETVSPLNETNQFLYDANNNLTNRIDPLGYTNLYLYDSQNRMTASVDERRHTNHFGYNSQFTLTGSTNANGDWTVLVYNTDGTLHTSQDEGGTTTYAYDSYGQLNGITYPSSLGSESFANDIYGDVTNHTDANSNPTTFVFDQRRQLITTIAPNNITNSISYDANGNVLTTTDARSAVTSNLWSATRHLLSTVYLSAPLGTFVTNGYDARDWLAFSEKPLQQITYFTNDPSHRLIALTDPLQRPMKYGYNADRRQIAGTNAATENTAQIWDAKGNLIQTISAATTYVDRVYDGSGNVIYLTNRNGKTWQFQYDNANHLINTTSPLFYSSSQIYNHRGSVLTNTDPKLQITSYGYDARGRMNSKGDYVGTNGYTYDGNSHLTLLTNVNKGIKLSWNYDANNRLSAFTNAAGYIIQYKYDGNGNLTNIVYPGSRPVYYAYDSLNRLTNVIDWSGRQTSYSYDLAGRLIGIVRPNQTLCSLGYDVAGELTNITEKAASQFPIAFYRLHYDPAGRTDWEFKGPPPKAFASTNAAMTYDDDNRLKTFNTTNVTVDDDGNLTYAPLTNGTFGTYVYDARNELTGAGGITYGYDPAGNRTSLTNGGNATTFVISPKGSELLMRIKGTTTNYYVYGMGLAYEVDETATTTNAEFYHFDSRGSTVAITDGNGRLTDQVEYSAYGVTTFRIGTSDTPFLFNGKFGVQTDSNGLLFMRARYYNPYLSRFLNPDPSGFKGGLNFYAFANGNPISLSDPFGLDAAAALVASWISPQNSSLLPALLAGYYDPMSQTVGGFGATESILEYGAAGFTIGNNLQIYSANFYGNQYVSTYNIGKTAEEFGPLLAGAAVAVDAFGYADNQISGPKFAVNTAFNTLAVAGGVAGATVSVIYYTTDTFFPGGALGAVEAYGSNVQAMRQYDPSFKITP